MKYILLLPALLFSLHAEAFLSRSDSEQVLQVLDRVCADSWCEGAYDIQFDSFRCSRYQRTCQVSMTFVDGEDRTATKHTCVIENVGHVDDVATSLGSAEPHLSSQTRQILNSCIESFYAAAKTY